jgi:hypothetical protein
MHDLIEVKNRNFINLIYKFREKVIHTFGMSRIISPIVAFWSDLIQIDHQIRDYVKLCGDSKSMYKYITDWGVVTREYEKGKKQHQLDPYFFATNITARLIKFADEYLSFIDYPEFYKFIDKTDQLRLN